MIEFQPKPELGHPSFIDVVRMYRKESNMSFEDAKEAAIYEFETRGWEHPFQYKGK